MIEVVKLCKRFDKFTVFENLIFQIDDGKICGLVGVNGAGKSTLLRIMAGIYKAEFGEVLYNGRSVYENCDVKSQIAFVPDDLFLPGNMSLLDIANKYKLLFEDFNYERFFNLIKSFGLDCRKPTRTFSKGMRRQGAVALALARETNYIFFDETFDGLDPFKRAFLKSVVRSEVEKRNITAIITSHSLRELEGLCDQLAIMDKGGLSFESDTARLEVKRVKVQIAFNDEFDIERFSGIDFSSYTQRGKVATFVLNSDVENALKALEDMSPLLLEKLPLSLEELFEGEENLDCKGGERNA